MLIVRTLYVLAIGTLLAAFVAFGVAAFYPRPDHPEYPETPGLEYPETPGYQDIPEEEQEQRQQEYERAEREYQREMDVYEAAIQDYNRTVFIVAAAASVIVLALNIQLLERVPVIGPGLTLGAVFTLFYGLVLAFTVDDDRLRFVASGIGLAILLFLAYRRFAGRNDGGTGRVDLE